MTSQISKFFVHVSYSRGEKQQQIGDQHSGNASDFGPDQRGPTPLSPTIKLLTILITINNT